MITAGIDMGSKRIKAVIMGDGKILGQSMIVAGPEKTKLAQQAFDEALKQAKLSKSDVKHIVATGSGAKAVTFAEKEATVVGADGRGAVYLFPSVRTVVDVGGEEGRAMKVDAGGKVIDFTVNEKCAAGAGTFIETMARTLEVPSMEEFGEISLKSTQSIPMNAQCAVFGESEVVSLIHQKTAKPDIARAVLDALAARIGSMTRTIGLTKDIAFIGGVAKNVGLVTSVNRNFELEIIVPKEPEFVGAIGAALIAAE